MGGPILDKLDKLDKLSKIKRVFSLFGKHQNKLYLAFLAVIVSTSISACLPLVFREILDKAIPSKDLYYITIISLAYLALVISQEAINFFMSLTVGWMGIEIVNNLKLKVLTHISTLSLNYFDKHGEGKLISLVESDSQRLYNVFSQSALTLVWGVLNLVVSMGIMLFTNIKLTLIVLSIAPVYIFCTYFIFSKLRPLYKKDRELYSKISGYLGEYLKAISLLRSLGNIPWSQKKFHQLNEDKRKFETSIYLKEMLTWFILMLAPQLVIALILYLSVDWIKNNIITFGTVWMFIQYVQSAIQPIFMISEQIGEIQRSMGAADRLLETLDTKPQVCEGTITDDNFKFEKEIRFENVSFGYVEGKEVLQQISFSIEKGKTLAIVGATGSGKTTIISLLSRFYDPNPNSGQILIDGIDIKNLTFKALRNKIGLILQDVYLFPGSVLDNLRMFRTDIPLEQVSMAATQMDIQNFIERLPNTYNTELAEDGKNLSFGERQLLSFARALTFNPQILIMDEATSSIDPQTEIKIQNSMNKLLQNRTAIIIAHRLSTIEHANKIIVLDKGRIVEEGNHQELLAKQGHYFNLHNTQQDNQQDNQQDTVDIYV
ncbi:MAG: ABC transporter ATP-binding protein [Oligoflexia bacterium]|nr:ABC transporter ATP-binding protein [Oligoflexia bacterium]